MASSTSSGAASDGQPEHANRADGLPADSRSYFYWTYPRGSFHYDIMVTLILLFIFVTPHLWDYGAKPPPVAGPLHPVQVVGDGRGVMITVQASDVNIPAGASDHEVKKALRKAIEPVIGDAVFVERWIRRPTHRAISFGKSGPTGKFFSTNPSWHIRRIKQRKEGHAFTKAILILRHFFALRLLPARLRCADDLQQVLQKLDAAAKNFHTTIGELSNSTPFRPTPSPTKM